MSILGLIGLAIIVHFLLRYYAQLMQEEDHKSAGAKLEKDLNTVGDSVWEWVSGCAVAGCGLLLVSMLLGGLIELITWALTRQ